MSVLSNTILANQAGLGAMNARAQGEGERDIMNLLASDALQRGGMQAAQAQAKGSAVIGAEKTAFATAGVDTQSGSALQAMVDSRMMSELDASTLRNNAAREAWGYKVKGMEAYQQGQAEYGKGMSKVFGIEADNLTSAALGVAGGGGGGGITSFMK